VNPLLAAIYFSDINLKHFCLSFWCIVGQGGGMAKENSSIRQRGSMVIHIHARMKFLQDLRTFFSSSLVF
jgi:hypothetical protein